MDGECNRQELEEIDRCRIGDDNLPCRRANQLADFVPNALRRADPIMAIPTANKAMPSFMSNNPRQPIYGLFGQSTERIAIQIDDAIRQRKTIAKTRQRI